MRGGFIVEASNIKTFLMDHRFSILCLGISVAFALSIFRFNFGSSSNYPTGTNALDTYIVNYAIKKFGIVTWNPLTDWGQPMVNVPTIVNPFIILLPETVYIRLFEFLSFLLASLTMYFVSRRFVKSEIAAISSGIFYMIAVETSQFFDGHTALMLSFAIFPLALLAIYDIIRKPGIKGAVILAFVFYILFSVGDIGAFYMIVVICFFEFIFLLARNVVRRKWDVGYIKFIALSVFLFLVSNSAWIYQYLSGNRPQFTTNVTTVILPFSQVGGQALYYSLVGFIADNSYTLFSLHNFEYSFIHGYSYLIFLVLPLMIFIYVAAKRDMILILLAVSAIPAIVISTANFYPVLTLFNEFLYFHFPLFNYIPALFRWNFYTDFVYAFILAYLVSDSLKVLSDKKIEWNRKKVMPLDKTLRDNYRKIRIRKVAALCVIFIFAFVIFGQNLEVFTEPPGTFSFPHQFTAGYSNLSQNSTSYVLTIPFGAVYSRTSYGGDSQSTEFMSPYFSGHNALMFQAGDPYSLQMDYFVGNGITYGLTNNITKFLSAANTGYVATTNYENWNQSSDAIYYPPLNYEGFQEQYDKGSLIYSSSNMTTYRLPNSGQIYFSPSYFVYFGGSSLLYDILNEPWYNGTSTPLINGSLLQSSQADQIICHSAGMVVTPTTANEITKYIPLASREGIPIIEVVDYSEMPNNSIAETYEPWNSSNAYAFDLINGSSLLPNSSFISNLSSMGYSSVNVSARAQTGDIFSISFSGGSSILCKNLITSFGNSSTLPWTNMSIVSAGINNQELYHYDGTVKLQTTNNVSSLFWTFTPENNTFQYLNFNYGNILNYDYLHFVQQGKPQNNYVFNAIISKGNTSYLSPDIESINLYNSSDNLTEVYFNLASFNSYAANLGKNVSVERFVVGLPKTGNQSSAILRDFELLNASDQEESGFQNINLGTSKIAGNSPQMFLNASSNVLFDTVTFAFTNETWNTTTLEFTKLFSIQSSPSDYSFGLNTTHSGILVFSQTYSNQWNLSGVTGDHVVVNIGLNGWFIDNSGKGIVNASITYSGETYLYHGMVIEIVLIVTTSGLLVIATRKRKINV